MKKLYSLGILLVMLLGIGFNASAVKATVEWETPGSVKIRTGSTSSPFVTLADDQTSYVFETEQPFGYVYVYATDGYHLVSGETTDGSRKFTPATWGGEPYISISVNSSLNGKTVKIDCVKLERNDEFTVDVQNGLDAITATFASGYTLDLQQGSHTYAFNPSIDQKLSVVLKGVQQAYEITLDGTPLTKNAYSPRYDNIAITPGSNLVIKVFEKEPVDCTLKIEYGEGMEGCLTNIRNATGAYFIMPADIVDNTITVKEGNELWFNFNSEDFTYSKFTLDGVDVTEKFKSNRLTVTITEETGTLLIEGAPKVYGNVTFTAYVMGGGENIEFAASYDGDPIEIGEGASVAADINILGNVMKAADTKEYSIPVSEKTARVFFRPKEGYYISGVYLPSGSSFERQSGGAAIDADEATTFYMFVEKLNDPYTANLKVIGDEFLTMKGSSSYSQNWDNPEVIRYRVDEGESTFSFIPGYNTPLTISADQETTSAVYLDGAAVKATKNDNANTNDYVFTPYYPETESAIKANSTVTVYADGTTGSIASASLTEQGGVTAGFFYSPVHHEANKTNQEVLKGTELIVVPSTTDCFITYKGEIVHGYKDDGTFVNGLNEAGEYVFVPQTNNRANVIVVGVQKNFTVGTVPADGSTVKSISSVTVTVPFIEGLADGNMIYIDQTKAMEINVAKADGTVVASIAELGEAGGNEAGETVFPFILDKTVDEAGEYIVTIPAGTFCEMAWDDAADDFVAVDGGYASSMKKSEVTVDPTVKSPLENYTVSPADGSALKSLESVRVIFPEFSAMDMFGYDFPYATFSNGTTEIDAYIGYDWNYSDARAFSVTPVDADDEPVVLTEDGDWTLTIPAGAFSYEGDKSPEITVRYNIGASNPVYPISPVPGSVTGDLSEIHISFPDAGEVEYNDTPVTLTGDNFSDSTTFVEGEGEYPTEFIIGFTNLPYAEGEYTVTIPAGTFTIDGEPSEAVTAVFTFKPVWKLTPAPGSTVESLDELTLEFPDATEVEFIGTPQSFMLVKGATYGAPSFDCTAVEGAAHPTFLLTLPEDAQQPPLGNLNFIIFDGAFSIDGKENTMINVPYTLDHAVSTEWTASPESTIVITEYGIDWAFIFDESARVSYPDVTKFHVSLAGQTLTADDFEIMPESNMMLMGIYDTSILKAGELVVSIEAGAFTIGKTPSPAIEYTWNVVAPKEYTSKVTPSADDKVSDLSRITVSFPDAATAEVFNSYGAFLRDNKYSYSATPKITAVENAEVPTFELTFDPAPSVSGSYVLSVRKGTFTLDGAQESPAIELTYDFDPMSGIAGIVADPDALLTVVSIDGRVILKDASVDELKNLPAGIYIVNGQKLMIK